MREGSVRRLTDPAAGRHPHPRPDVNEAQGTKGWFQDPERPRAEPAIWRVLLKGVYDSPVFALCRTWACEAGRADEARERLPKEQRRESGPERWCSTPGPVAAAAGRRGPRHEGGAGTGGGGVACSSDAGTAEAAPRRSRASGQGG